MKTLSFSRVTLLALMLATGSLTATFAQTPAPTSPDSATTAHQPVLTPDEKAQFKKDRDQVLAADPQLKSVEDNLKQQHDTLKSKGDNATEEDKMAFHAQKHEHEQNVRMAMLKLDPSIAPILTKMEAAHKGHHHDAAATGTTAPATGA